MEFDSSMAGSECHGLVTAQVDADYQIANSDGMGCDKKPIVEDPLLPINVVWMVNPRLLQVADSLSFFISQMHQQLVVQNLKKKHLISKKCTEEQKRIAVQARQQRNQQGKEEGRCLKGGGGKGSSGSAVKADDLGEDGDEQQSSLGYKELAGLFLIMAFVIAVTCVLYVRRLLQKRREADNLNALQSNNDELQGTEVKVALSEGTENGHCQATLRRIKEKMQMMDRVEKLLNAVEHGKIQADVHIDASKSLPGQSSNAATENREVQQNEADGPVGMAFRVSLLEQSLKPMDKLLADLSERLVSVEKSQTELVQVLQPIAKELCTSRNDTQLRYAAECIDYGTVPFAKMSSRDLNAAEAVCNGQDAATTVEVPASVPPPVISSPVPPSVISSPVPPPVISSP